MLSLAIIGRLFTAVVLLMAVWLAFRPDLARGRGGKVFAFAILFLLPILATWGGGTEQMETSKQTRFCLSCHVMTDFGRSLYYDDPGYLPAAHYQNRRIPRDQACYACHSGYTYFGGVKSKWRGLRHVYVQYFGNVPRPNEIRLYSPFPNATCLHCHEGARTFEEKSAHHRDAELLNRVRSGTQSCMSSGCHDIIHEVAGINEGTFWKETP
jgi:nitrate/TMAO reductase-like tetraheme cytochrome c subunit